MKHGSALRGESRMSSAAQELAHRTATACRGEGLRNHRYSALVSLRFSFWLRSSLSVNFCLCQSDSFFIFSFSLSLSLSVSPSDSFCLFLSLPLFLSLSLSPSLSLSLSLFHSVSLPFSLVLVLTRSPCLCVQLYRTLGRGHNIVDCILYFLPRV